MNIAKICKNNAPAIDLIGSLLLASLFDWSQMVLAVSAWMQRGNSDDHSQC